jgi:hypothetical protein
MSWLKDIIEDHERAETREIKERDDATAQAKAKKSEEIKTWMEFVNNVLIPVLTDAEKQLGSAAYECKIAKPSVQNATGGDNYIKSISLEVNMGKSRPGFHPSKATITFAHIQDKGIKISEISSSKGPIKESFLSIDANETLVQIKIKDFLKGTWK